MHKAVLRKVGGSVMLAVPPAILDLLRVQPGGIVGLTMEDGRLIVEPERRPRYTLEELLSQCDATEELSTEDRLWSGGMPEGSELI